MTLRKEIEEKIGNKCHDCINDATPWHTLADQICSLIKERLEKITDGYQITKTQAKVNALIKEIKGE